MRKIILLLAILCFSCQVKEEFKTITIEKNYSLSIPDNLEPSTELNSDASLQYQDIINDFYVIVIDESKESFNSAVINNGSPITPDLNGYYKTLASTLPQSLENCKMYDHKTTTIQGMKAKIFSVTGTIENMDIYYRYAILEGHAHYYQIMLWTKKTKEDQYKALMDKTILSFREIGSKNTHKLFKE